MWEAVHSTFETELQQYATVIHLRTPGADQGYNHVNPMRTESADAAALIDARIADIWSAHPNVVTIPATVGFLTKANAALEALRAELPACCGLHVAPDSAANRSRSRARAEVLPAQPSE